MKILIVNYEYPPLGGGGGVATKDLAQELARPTAGGAPRHTLHVITSAWRGLPRHEVQSGVHIHRVPVLGRTKLPTATIFSMVTFVPSAFWRGILLCRTVSFDVINGQFVLPSGLPAAILAGLFRRPFVLSLIGGDLYDPSKGISPHRYAFLRALIRAIARRARVITAISQDTAKRARDSHGVTQPITVIPIGLVPRSVAAATRAQLQLPDGFLAVSIGRLIPRKGYHVLLQALAILKKTQRPAGSAIRIIIVGDGPLLSGLKQKVGELGIEEFVYFLGHVPETKKQQILRAADAYVSAASHEGFGIVFLEAMNAGLPIIAPAEGGQTDFLVPGRGALLVDSSSPQAVAGALLRLAEDGALRHRMGEENKKAVEKYFIHNTAAAFERVLYESRY